MVYYQQGGSKSYDYTSELHAQRKEEGAHETAELEAGKVDDTLPIQPGTNVFRFRDS
jgi:hypothetical protein